MLPGPVLTRDTTGEEAEQHARAGRERNARLRLIRQRRQALLGRRRGGDGRARQHAGLGDPPAQLRGLSGGGGCGSGGSGSCRLRAVLGQGAAVKAAAAGLLAALYVYINTILSMLLLYIDLCEQREIVRRNAPLERLLL